MFFFSSGIRVIAQLRCEIGASAELGTISLVLIYHWIMVGSILAGKSEITDDAIEISFAGHCVS